MHFSAILTFLGLLTFGKCFYSDVCKPKIAIIGSGIGGASAAHFLTSEFDGNLEIDLFERSDLLGGRLATIRFGDDEYEAGGSVIHPRNKYMYDFLKLLNLDVRPESAYDGLYGVWNGRQFVFIESEYESITLFKLIYRYGWQPISLHNYIKTVLDDFAKIYDLQENGHCYENVTALLSAMNKNFPQMMQISTKNHLLNLGYKARLVDELVKSTLVVNYGQDTEVQSFVGVVSVAGASSGLWSVENGNKEIPRNLIMSNDKVNVVKSAVKKIERHEGMGHGFTKYEVFFEKPGTNYTKSRIYDIVIVAAPMTEDQETQIVFSGFPNADNFKFEGEFQTTIATFVKGILNPDYFGLAQELVGILSCEPDETIVSSVGAVSSVTGKVENRTKIWKVFSRRFLNETVLDRMFLQISEIKYKLWKAYPRYSSTSRLDSFKLDDYLYHVNAIEWAASAMEMSAIGGRNVANLALRDFSDRCPQILTNQVNRRKRSCRNDADL